MTQWVGLLRGVNVGGHNKVPMAALRQACVAHGWDQVQSYIASGNLVFAADGDAAGLADELRDIVRDSFDLEVSAMVFSKDQIGQVLDQCPCSESPGNLGHAIFYASKPVVDHDALEALRVRSETLVVGEHAAWLHAPEGVARSKLFAKIGKVLTGQPLTARNLTTVRKLVEMLDARAEG